MDTSKSAKRYAKKWWRAPPHAFPRLPGVQREFLMATGAGLRRLDVISDLAENRSRGLDYDDAQDVRADGIGCAWHCWISQGPGTPLADLWKRVARETQARRKSRTRLYGRSVSLSDVEDDYPETSAEDEAITRETEAAYNGALEGAIDLNKLAPAWRMALAALKPKLRDAFLARLAAATDEAAAERLHTQARTVRHRVAAAVAALPPDLPGLAEWLARKQ